MAGVASVPVFTNKGIRVMGGRLGGRTVLYLSHMGGRQEKGEHIGQGPVWQHGTDKYSRLDQHLQNANSHFLEEQQAQQQLIAGQQDEQLELVSGTIGVLKNMSERIGVELDEQAVMLDDFSHEVDKTHSKLDNVMKKLAKVSHMTSAVIGFQPRDDKVADWMLLEVPDKGGAKSTSCYIVQVLC
ncbi:Syntaxin-6 [Takifugu flavidus]|uniref:Syntaxin-6 n=1 Tax=Takifugu flavidus TaxID=433684 RepID=A0A5C6MT98_9TELE|nr:Syntaxin-6 [Takifugu flavidus]